MESEAGHLMENDILLFHPQFMKRIWGGDGLRRVFGNAVPASGRYGEAWLVSAVPGNSSTVSYGTYAGRSLSDLWKNDRTLFPDALGDFPLLVKMIDAGDRLSVQVHPDDAYAREFEHSSGKTECWYVLSADPGAQIVDGHTAGNRAELATAATDGTIERFLNRIDVHPGDFIFVPAGTLHAIGGGIVLLEIQQTSDVTYRIYDYHRLGENGIPRPLQIDRGIAVTEVPSKPASIVHPTRKPGMTTLVEAPQFTVRRLISEGSTRLVNEGYGIVGTIVAGHALANGIELEAGKAFVLPQSVREAEISGVCEIIIAHVGREVCR
jgi:mannose-6-phosphate isomerase